MSYCFDKISTRICICEFAALQSQKRYKLAKQHSYNRM